VGLSWRSEPSRRKHIKEKKKENVPKVQKEDNPFPRESSPRLRLEERGGAGRKNFCPPGFRGTGEGND